MTLHEPAAGSRLGGREARAHPAPDSPGYRHGGAASLATAGVVAYHLPRPAQVTATNGTATPAPAATQPSTAGRHADDDGGGEGITAPGGTASQAQAHADSGGS